MVPELVNLAGPRLPNLVIVGVSKAGTTSMFHYLGQHPDVGTSDVKELRYFTPLRYGEPLTPLEGYTAHFRHCVDQTYAMEATPGYFYGGRSLARTLRETCPGVRAVVILRSPEERCWSWYGFVKSRLRIPKQMGFAEYLDRCFELHDAGVDHLVENQPFWGVGGGCYDSWLPEWVEELGDRFRVVFFEDLTGDPAAAVGDLCEWLDLDHGPVENFDFAVGNKTQAYKNRALQRAAVVINRRGERFFHRHVTLKRLIRTGYYRLNRAGSERMRDGERERLAAFYRPHNARLADQLAPLGLRLPATWKSG